MFELKVMSFNVRGAGFEDGENSWEHRADLNVRTVRKHAPDLVGLQEFQQGNRESYEGRFPEYGLMMGPKANNSEPHEYMAILWRTSRLELLDSGGFWISRTWDRHSADWNTACIRSAHWARFRCAGTDIELLFLNTHLDHVSELARVEGSRLIAERLRELRPEGVPVILTGDFNCEPGSPTYRNFVDAGFRDVYLASGSHDAERSNTFHGFRVEEFVSRKPDATARIDWILTLDGAHGLRARSCEILRDHEGALYPSDHYPLLAELELT